MSGPDDELLTARQAADRAGVTRGTIRLWERAGRLHPIPAPPRGPLYSAAELQRAMDRTTQARAASETGTPSDAAAAPRTTGGHADWEAAEWEAGIPEAEVAELEVGLGSAEAADLAEAKGDSERARRASKPPAVLIRERLLRGSGWVLLGTVAATLLGTFANGLLFKVVGKTNFGVYALAFSIATIGGTLSQLGTERAVVRLVAAALGTGLPGRARRTLRIVYASALIGSVFVALLLVLGLGEFLAVHVFKASAHATQLSSLIVFVAVWVIASAFQSLFAESFRAFQSFWLATLFNGLIFDIVAVAVFGTIWLRGGHVALADAILLTVGCITVSLLASVWVLAKRYRTLPREPGSIRVREVFDVAWPLLGFNMATFLVGTGVDLWVVGALTNPNDVALYAAASKLVFYVGTAFIIASQVVPPVIAELWAQGKKNQLERSLREVATLAGIPGVLVLLMFVFFGREVLRVVYLPSAEGAATVLAILSIARLYAVVTGNSGVALQMTGYQRTMFYLTVFTGVCSLTAEIFFGRRYGIVGVAWATAGAQIMQNTLQLVYAKRKLGIWTQAELSLRPFIALVKRTA
jgi:O-antigen/teichoic acid export membrane protein